MILGYVPTASVALTDADVVGRQFLLQDLQAVPHPCSHSWCWAELDNLRLLLVRLDRVKQPPPC